MQQGRSFIRTRTHATYRHLNGTFSARCPCADPRPTCRTLYRPSHAALTMSFQLHRPWTVEEVYGDLIQGGDERTPMRIRFKVNQPANRSPCEHQHLTLNGRYLTLRGIDLTRSRERYTCNACGKPVVRTLNASGSYLVSDHHATPTSPSTPSDAGN